MSSFFYTTFLLLSHSFYKFASCNKTIFMNEQEKQNIINEFNLYLREIKEVGKRARVNYISWARFLMRSYDLSKVITKEQIEVILKNERSLLSSPDRKVYKKESDIGNFRATLNRFLPFMQCYTCKKLMESPSLSIDDMIDMIADQSTMDKAIAMDEAIRIMVFERNYILSVQQKQRMKDNIGKLKGSSAVYIQNYNDNCQAKVNNY